MGAICSRNNLSPDEQRRLKDENKRNRQLDAKMNLDHSADQQINKLLLLGAGESGKSTLFKQMITLYGKGFDPDERRTFKGIIHNNVLTSMKTLCRQSQNFGPVQSPAAEEAKAWFDDCKGDEVVDSAVGGRILTLWNDPGIQHTYDNRSRFQLTDSAAYFFDKMEEVMREDYLPSEQDVLRSRVRTTGIVENSFSIDGNQFKMYDVGGQRNERKKWIHCFENVTAVLFVAAISAYDQVLYEDENTNRMEEALNLFEEICNSRWFREVSMILFLNKCDLFAEKIKKVPLSEFFADYNGDNSYEHATEWIRMEFQGRNRQASKQVYSHITCATDTDNVNAVFNAVKDIIIRRSLNEAGLV